MAREPRRARLAYHASHLRYYRKHNGLSAQLALRARDRACADWRRSRAATQPRAAEALALLKLALRGA